MAGPDTLRKILDLAENRYHSGDYREAIQLWEKALNFDPENRRAREGAKMARMLIEAGEKLPDEKRAQESDSGEPAREPETDPDPGSLDGVGNLQGLMDDNEVVANDLKVHIDRGWELLRSGDREGALQECQEALVLDAGNPEVMKLHAELSREGESVIQEVDIQPEEDADAADPDETPETARVAAGSDLKPPAAGALPEREPEPGAAEAVDPEFPAASPSLTQPVVPADLESEPPAELTPEIEAEVTPEVAADPSVVDEPGDPDPAGAASPEPDDLLVPDALKAGGTEYGQWEDEFSELDLDQSVQNVGTDPGPGAGDLDFGAGPSDSGTIGEPEAGAALPDAGDAMSEPEPEPVPLAEPGEIVTPEGIDTTAAEAAMPVPDPEPALEPEEIPQAEDGFEEELQTLAAAPVMKAQVPKPASRRGGRGLIAVILVVIAAAAGGWFYFLRGTGFSADRDEPPPPAVKPNPGAGPQGPPQPESPPAVENQAQAGAGSEEIQLPPAQPEPPPAPGPETVRPLSESEKRQKVNDMLRTGRRLYDEGKYDQAQDILSGALALDPVNFELKDLLDQVSSKAAEERQAREAVELARNAFEDGDFEIVLRKLYRTPTGAEQEPTRTYIRNTWFNWGVQLLKAGNCPEAKKKFQEVQALSPDDREIVKLINVADRYARQAKDDIYFAFIDELKFRDLDSP